MIVVIDNIPTDISLQTVSLAPDNKSLLFRCYHCGTTINRVAGRVVDIAAGIIPSPDITSIIQCHGCKENYTFQSTIEYEPEDLTEITLAPEPFRNVSTFHCIICRTPLLQYNKDTVFLLPTLLILKLPAVVECLKPDCRHKYKIKEVVSTEL